MWYERDISDLIRRAAATRPAVVLTGSRQVGKSSLLRRLFPKHSYASLDLPTDAEQAELAPQDFLARFPPPVIIDEIQYAPAIFRPLKKLIDQRRDIAGQFILTGSQNFSMMTGVNESLAGRCAVIVMEGLRITELGTLASPDWSELIFRGGYPEVWANPEVDPSGFYRSLTTTYLERDVRQVLNVGSLRDFERFLRACALRSGQMLNKAELARDVGIKSPTANAWLSVLQALGVVALLEPWFSNRSKSIVKTPKLYLCDSGLLCHLLAIARSEDVPHQRNIGAIWETFVFAQLRRQQLNATGGWELYYFRDRELEADFLRRNGDRYELADAKWTPAPRAADFGSLEQVAAKLGIAKAAPLTLWCRAEKPIALGDGRIAAPPA